MKTEANPDIRGAPRAFTLIELIVAISLLVLLLLACSLVFGTTSQSVGESVAVNETALNIALFDRILRRDVAAMEHDGILVIGRREFSAAEPAYSMRRRRDAGRAEPFRCDWITFFTNTEQAPNADARMIGQSGRVIFGHGLRTNRSSLDFSNVATDWMLMRHLYVRRVQGLVDAQLSVERRSDIDNSNYMLSAFAARRFKWYGDGSPVNEPDNYFDYLRGEYSRRETWGKGVLPYCAEFRIEYAMRSDLAGGKVNWRQPPKVGSGNPQDPNYDPSDPLHNNQFNSTGRLSFGPGDDWPVLLRASIIVVDPLERIGEKSAAVLLPVP